jgi:hypothetical protein
MIQYQTTKIFCHTPSTPSGATHLGVAFQGLGEILEHSPAAGLDLQAHLKWCSNRQRRVGLRWLACTCKLCTQCVPCQMGVNASVLLHTPSITHRHTQESKDITHGQLNSNILLRKQMNWLTSPCRQRDALL